MRRKLWVLIGLFVLGMSGCPLPDTSVTNAANESVTEQVNTTTPEALPVSTPHKVTKKYSGVAIGDRRLWTESVNTQNGFDRASRAAILFYALELDEQKAAENKTFNRPSVNKWLNKELNLAEQNYHFAAETCQSNDWTCIGTTNNSDDFIAKARALRVPAALDSWQEKTAEFVGTYVAEQIHLADVFPTTSSEIDLFNDNEWNGDKFGDRQFFLTFDDGPTAPGGNTDNVLQMLAAQKKTATFFVLGQNFANRQKTNDTAALAGLYKGQCVGAHGWEHLSHEKRSPYAFGNKWQSSVTDTIALIKNSFAGTPIFLRLFRPPYGQRKSDSGAFFQKEGLQVALWNMDSQDWNAQIDAEDIINRMEILMLIKRRGVLLFHDIHPKAQKAVPVIIADFGSAVEWGDCHRIAE
ncbi:MAG TPA: polysaccharide deacetylase family protein [Pyrinomonadaceae bacterium]|nr:polysaccharide deacetylase family protein [Pyrinomonadaceae bacterium]